MWLELEVCRLTGSGKHFLCFTTLAAGSAKSSTPHLAGTGRAVINHQMVHFLEPCKVSLSNLIICCVLRITPAEVCHGHQNLPTVVTPLSKPRVGFHGAPANIPTVAQHLYPPSMEPSPRKHGMKKGSQEILYVLYLSFLTDEFPKAAIWLLFCLTVNCKMLHSVVMREGIAKRSE